MAKATAAQQQSRKVISTYLPVDYRETFNDMLEKMEVNRYDYLRSLVLKDMVRRGVLDPMEVRRAHRSLLEL